MSAQPDRRHHVRGGTSLAVAAVLTVALTLAGSTAPAAASIQIEAFSVTPSTPQAGGHPNLNLYMKFCKPAICTDEEQADDPKDIVLHLPPGLLGNPRAVPHCSIADLDSDLCPANTAVGSLVAGATAQSGLGAQSGEVYNLDPLGSEAARFGILARAFNVTTNQTEVSAVPSIASATVRPTDAGVDSTTLDLPRVATGLTIRINWVDLTLCGSAPVDKTPGLIANPPVCQPVPGLAQQPFTVNPTSCVPATFTLQVNSYNDPGTYQTASSTFTPTGCDTEPFTPSVAVSRHDPASGFNVDDAGAPVGYTVGIDFPDSESDPIHQAHLNRAEVTLPAGVTLSPGAAQGLEGCSAAQFGLGDANPDNCPDGSKVGDVKVTTPILDTDPSTPALDPLTGNVYFAKPDSPGGPTADHPWRLYIEIHGGGVRLKLQGETTIDPTTGQIKTLFENNPQTPFTHFELSLRGGDRAILANPVECGSNYKVSGKFTPWSAVHLADPSSKDVIDESDPNDLKVNNGCPTPRPFQLGLDASATPTQAGAFSTSRLLVSRPDGHQLLKTLDLSLPPGAAGSLGAVPLCPLAQAQGGSCSEDSKVGTIHTSVGAGAGLLNVGGSIYLAEPSLPGDAATVAVAIPAKVGPIDLGQVVLLNRVILRQSDGGLDVKSGEIPTTLGGIPLPVRQIEILVNREGFFRNPTGCDPRSTVATFTSDQGQTASATSVGQATGCDALPFAPRLRMFAGGPGQTAVRSHPPLRAVVTERQGEAAIKGSVVTLPEILRPNLPQLQKPGALCSDADLANGTCSPNSLVGTATATTPLLPSALSGPIHIVQHTGQVLPDLVVSLHGVVSLQLNAGNTIAGVRTVNTFSNLPDVPVSSFELNVNGGSNGILNAFRDLCAEPTVQKADAVFTGHNGKTFASRPELQVEGCATAQSRVSIATRRVRMTRSGVVPVRIACPAQLANGCKGRLTLATAGKVSVAAKRRKLTLGRRSYSIPAGETGTVKVRLSRTGRAAVLRRKRLSAKATATLEGAKSATATIRITAPGGKK